MHQSVCYQGGCWGRTRLDFWTPDCCTIYAATPQNLQEEAFMDVENEVPYDATHEGVAKDYELNHCEDSITARRSQG